MGFYIADVGKETQTPFPCPTPPSRLKTIKLLTHVNNLRHHYKCQRRFARFIHIASERSIHIVGFRSRL
jgi:hypothetical protein